MKIPVRACEKGSRKDLHSTTHCGMILSPNLHVRIHLTTPWQRALVDQHPLETLLLQDLKMNLKLTDRLGDGPRAWEAVETWEAMGIGTYTPLD